GATTALAYFAPASAHLLVVLLLAMFLGRGHRAERRRDVSFAVVALTVHLALVASVSAAAPRLLGTAPATDFVHEFLWSQALWSLQHPEGLWRAVVAEWLWPFAPLSVAWFAGVLHHRTRRLALIFAAVIGLYLATAFLMLAQAEERGAYLLPLAWPAAWLVMHALQTRWVIVLALTGGTLAVLAVASHDAPERCRAWADGVRELAQHQPMLLLTTGDAVEVEACAVWLRGTPYIELGRTIAAGLAAVEVRSERMARDLGARLDRGEQVYLTSAAHAVLTQHPQFSKLPAAAALMRTLSERFVLEPVAAKGFAGFAVVRGLASGGGDAR
ncbi:MAG: hypothetical protein AAF628_29530, partial [Planctomycetota bacterium]